MKNVNFAQQSDEYERDQRAKRHRFIERMEQKLRFKESMRRSQHRSSKYLLN